MSRLKLDYKRIYKTATEEVLIGSSTIMSLPVDIYSHIKEETDIKIMSYETALKKHGANAMKLGSRDAVLNEQCGRYVLFYNMSNGDHRNRWSYAHELAHFHLGHELNVEKLTDQQYKLQEDEADYFAAQVLMPDLIIWELVQRGVNLTVGNISKWFDVSEEASKIRKRTLNAQSTFKDYYRNDDYYELLMIKFGNDIDKIIPKHVNYSNYYGDDEEMQKERDSWNYRK